MFYPSRHSGLSLIYMNLGLKSYITSSFFAHRYLQCGFGLEFLYVRDTLFASPNLLIFSLFCAPGRLIFVGCISGFPCSVFLFDSTNRSNCRKMARWEKGTVRATGSQFPTNQGPIPARWLPLRATLSVF